MLTYKNSLTASNITVNKHMRNTKRNTPGACINVVPHHLGTRGGGVSGAYNVATTETDTPRQTDTYPLFCSPNDENIFSASPKDLQIERGIPSQTLTATAGGGQREEVGRMCVEGDGCAGVPISLCVCVCVFLHMPYNKRCIDAVHFVCGAHYGGSRGDNGAVHK